MKNHPARLEPGKGKYMLYFILNERAVPPPPGRGDAGECQRRRIRGASASADVPRRCRGLTEDVTARAVMLCHCCERRWRCYVGALETRYYGSGASESVEGEVRRADPFSVNFYLCTINRKLRETLRIVKKKDRDGELLC